MLQVLVLVGVDFFPLQRLHEAFATGIVVGICRPTHARNHVVLLEDGYISRASVLQPAIRVMATRLERKHKRALTTILPEEHRPNRLFPVGSEQSSAALKSTPTTNFRFSDSCE